MKNGIFKPVFHFNHILAKHSAFHCFVNSQAELMIWTVDTTEYATFHHDTVEVENELYIGLWIIQTPPPLTMLI